MTAYEALTKKYLLEASLAELESRCAEIRESLPELKYRMNSAMAGLREMESSMKELILQLAQDG